MTAQTKIFFEKSFLNIERTKAQLNSRLTVPRLTMISCKLHCLDVKCSDYYRILEITVLPFLCDCQHLYVWTNGLQRYRPVQKGKLNFTAIKKKGNSIWKWKL